MILAWLFAKRWCWMPDEIQLIEGRKGFKSKACVNNKCNHASTLLTQHHHSSPHLHNASTGVAFVKWTMLLVNREREKKGTKGESKRREQWLCNMCNICCFKFNTISYVWHKSSSLCVHSNQSRSELKSFWADQLLLVRSKNKFLNSRGAASCHVQCLTLSATSCNTCAQKNNLEKFDRWNTLCQAMRLELYGLLLIVESTGGASVGNTET